MRAKWGRHAAVYTRHVIHKPSRNFPADSFWLHSFSPFWNWSYMLFHMACFCHPCRRHLHETSSSLTFISSSVAGRHKNGSCTLKPRISYTYTSRHGLQTKNSVQYLNVAESRCKWHHALCCNILHFIFEVRCLAVDIVNLCMLQKKKKELASIYHHHPYTYTVYIYRAIKLVIFIFEISDHRFVEKCKPPPVRIFCC